MMLFEKHRQYRPLLGDTEDQNSDDEPIAVEDRPSKPGIWLKILAQLVQPLIIGILLAIITFGVYREKARFHSRCVRELHTPCLCTSDPRARPV